MKVEWSRQWEHKSKLNPNSRPELVAHLRSQDEHTHTHKHSRTHARGPFLSASVSSVIYPVCFSACCCYCCLLCVFFWLSGESRVFDFRHVAASSTLFSMYLFLLVCASVLCACGKFCIFIIDNLCTGFLRLPRKLPTFEPSGCSTRPSPLPFHPRAHSRSHPRRRRRRPVCTLHMLDVVYFHSHPRPLPSPSSFAVVFVVLCVCVWGAIINFRRLPVKSGNVAINRTSSLH